MGTERRGTPQGEPVNVTGAALCHTGSCQCRTARSPSSAGLHHPAGAITDHHYTPATEATLASHDSLFDWVGVGAPHDFRACMSPADTAFTYLCLVHLMLLKCAVTVSQMHDPPFSSCATTPTCLGEEEVGGWAVWAAASSYTLWKVGLLIRNSETPEAPGVHIWPDVHNITSFLSLKTALDTILSLCPNSIVNFPLI